MKKTNTRILPVFAMISLSICALPMATFAQDAEESEKVLDSVVVKGTQNDAAMAAFRAGDYATAEVEFLDNAMCALRRERNTIASIDSARTNAARAEVFADAVSGDSGANSRGAGAGQGQDIPTGIASASGVAARNIQTELDRTCEKRGRQLYFAGLSQIQLGKTDEALRNFESATVASKVLYDAHYKIGLIKLLNGDRKSAASELKDIERILKRCKKCEARQEIVDRRDHLSKAIKGEIKLH
ncbi:MAG: hypothetical protein ABNH53_08450 [Henriciella sp.]|jgi:TolA-binding protein